MSIKMSVTRDDFGLIRLAFWEPGGKYKSAVWLTPIDAALLVEALAPILREEAAKSPVVAVVPLDDVIDFQEGELRKAMDLDNWKEMKGFGSVDGAKCPHCGFLVQAAALSGLRGEMECPQCTQRYQWREIVVGDRRAWSTLTNVAKPV
jgi:hypothetical protein